MFTGIIEEIGFVTNTKHTGQSSILTIEAKRILGDVKLGDSIAVNGVCLTVTSFTNKEFTVDVMPETIKATSLRNVQSGSHVNLERAMAAGGRFGGHFVSGHVDGVGIVKEKREVANAVYYEIEAANDLLQYIIEKGSVAVDGTSLTVFGVTETTFLLSLIPHTLAETVLGQKDVGDIVNIENDMIGKYIAHFLSNQRNQSEKQASSLSSKFLEEHGFK